MDYIVYNKLLLADGSYLLQGDGVGRFRLAGEISDAAFLQWLRDPASRVTLLAEVKFAYQSAGLPAEGTVYLSDRTYIDESTTPPQPYIAAIESAPTFERALDIQQLGGRVTATLGDLALANADGNLDYLLDYILDGRDVAFYIGDPTWERAQFRQIGAGTVASVRANGTDKLAFTLRDRGLMLDATIIGDEMTTGPNTGKPKPVLFGQVYNFDLTPYLYDETGPSYYFNNYAMDASLAFANVLVRDAGVSLINAGFSGTNADITADAGTDTISKTAHGLLENDVVRFSGTTPFAGLAEGTQYWVIAAGLTANAFRVSTSRGGSAADITGTSFPGTLAVSSRRYFVDAAAASITLSSPPDGRVTADILTQGTTGDAAIQNVPHAGFRYILDTWTRLTSADRAESTFANLVATQQANGVQWGRAILDRTNVMAVLDDIAVATNSWTGWTNAGLLAVGKLDLANLDSATPVDTITEDDIEGEPNYEIRALPFGKLIVDANRNTVTQTDGLATSVSAEDRSTWAQQFRTRVKTTDPEGLNYLNDWWTFHRTAIDSAPLEIALIGNEETVQAYCDERSALFAPWTAVFSCTVGLDKWELDPGDCVELIFSRYGLDSGKNFRVASVRTRPGDKAVDLVLVRQNVPDWDALGVGVVAPSAPTIGTATGANTKATVTFTAPTNNGGASITAYRVTSSPGAITADGTASPIIVTGLTNGVAYTFTVKALNSAGYGTDSAASNSVTPATTVPDAPTGLSAIAASATSATVTFTAPVDNGGSAILDYTVTSSPGGLTSSAGASPRTVSGLTSGTEYTFTATARNANGSSAASAASNAITPGNRAVALTIASNYGTGYNIFAQAGYPTDAVDVTLTINAAVDVYSDNGTTLTVLTTGTGWVAGSTIKIVNNGYILGCGGAGGNGDTVQANGTDGDPGYQAIDLRWNVVIDNTGGYIFGGGGGGGGGGAVYDQYGGGGGGGAGYGQRSSYSANYGQRLTGGVAGAGVFSAFVGTSGAGGDGGAPGTAGAGGADSVGINGFPSYAGGAGGAAGKAIALNGYAVTWLGGNNGTQVKGAVS